MGWPKQSTGAFIRNESIEGSARFIEKPLSPYKLLEAVRDILGSADEADTPLKNRKLG